MKRLQTGPKTALCANPRSPFCYFGWPSIARLADGRLAVTASGFRLEHICPFGKGVISYSADEGETWSAPAAVIDTPLDDRDSGIVPFGDGRAIFTSFNNTVQFQRRVNASRHADPSPAARAKARLIDAYLDYIQALGDPERFLGSMYRLSEDGGVTFGPIRHVPVSAPHGPCRLNDGSLLYVGRRFDGNDESDEGEKPYLECWHMDADGEEFRYVSSIENVSMHGRLMLTDEPHCVQMPDGRLVVHIRVQNRRGGEEPRVFTVFQSVSTDRGRTFSRPVQLLGDLGGSPAHLLLHSSGTLISAYGYREAPYGIRVMFSRDAGETWDADYVLDDEGQSGDLGYPSTVGLRDGSLLTVFYENRDGQSRIQRRVWRLPE